MRLTLNCPASWLPLFVFCLLIVSGCKKSDSPAPDLATKVMGTYTFTMVSVAGSQPTAVTGGSAALLRNGTALDKVDMTVSYATAGTSGSSNFSETRPITLQLSGVAIDLYSGTTRVGTWVNNTITFTNYPFNNSTVNFTAAK